MEVECHSICKNCLKVLVEYRQTKVVDGLSAGPLRDLQLIHISFDLSQMRIIEGAPIRMGQPLNN